jgi:hypothetical protein
MKEDIIFYRFCESCFNQSDVTMHRISPIIAEVFSIKMLLSRSTYSGRDRQFDV